MGDLLSELEIELVENIALALRDPKDLVALAATCQTLRNSVLFGDMWRQRVQALLGGPLVALHQTAWGIGNKADATFYRRLFRVALTGGEVCYANTLRKEMSNTFTSGEISQLICSTGHTAGVCGHLVAVVGGWRAKCAVPHLHTYIIDVTRGKLHTPSLCEGSAKPMRRLRHASSVGRKGSTPDKAAFPTLLPQAEKAPLQIRQPCPTSSYRQKRLHSR